MLATTLSADGRLLASVARSVRVVDLIDPATGKETRRLVGHRNRVGALAFSPDGSTLASGGDEGLIRLWDVATGQEKRPAGGHRAYVSSVSFLADGHTLVSASWDGSVRLWDAARGRELRRWDYPSVVAEVAFSPDGLNLASTGEGVCLRDVDSGKVLHQLGDQGQRFGSVAFSGDSRLLAGGAYGAISVWGTATGKLVHQLRGHPDGTWSLIFTPDNQSLVVLGGWNQRHLSCVDLKTGQERWRKDCPFEELQCVALSPDGQTLAWGGGMRSHGGIHLCNAATGKEIRFLDATKAPCAALTFSPDGKTLVSGGWSSDPSIRLWNVATGKLQRRLEGHRGAIRCLAFAPDGRRLASASTDTTILIWDAEK
jgi:WD40 repeat protein